MITYFSQDLVNSSGIPFDLCTFRLQKQPFGLSTPQNQKHHGLRNMHNFRLRNYHYHRDYYHLYPPILGESLQITHDVTRVKRLTVPDPTLTTSPPV